MGKRIYYVQNTHIHTHRHIHTHMHASVCVCVYVCVCMYIYAESYLQIPIPDIIADSQKHLLTGRWYCCLLRGSARAWPILMWMHAANHRTWCRDPNEEVRAEGVCNPMGRSTISTNQTPPRLPGTKSPTRVHLRKPMAPAACVAENGFILYQWEERPLVLWKFDTQGNVYVYQT